MAELLDWIANDCIGITNKEATECVLDIFRFGSEQNTFFHYFRFLYTKQLTGNQENNIQANSTKITLLHKDICSLLCEQLQRVRVKKQCLPKQEYHCTYYNQFGMV